MSKKDKIKKDFENTVLAMSEWLDEHVDGYFLTLTLDGQSGMIKAGDDDHVIESLADGMVAHPELREVILSAVAVAMEELDQSHHCGGDINDFNAN